MQIAEFKEKITCENKQKSYACVFMQTSQYRFGWACSQGWNVATLSAYIYCYCYC